MRCSLTSTTPSTLLEAWASHKGFRPKDGTSGDGPAGRSTAFDFKSTKRTSDTPASTTDPDARLHRKSNNTAAQLSYAGHLLIEHRCALILDAELTHADGYADATAQPNLEPAPETTAKTGTGPGSR